MGIRRVLVSLVVLFNTLLTGGELRGVPENELHIYVRIPVLGTPISAESVAYAIAQLLRFGSMAAMGFPIAFAVAPGDIGPTFARLGVPYKFRLCDRADVPLHSVTRRRHADDDRRAARARPRVGWPSWRAEDTIDAMDLRAFGTGKRTWLRHLRFDGTDWAVLGGFTCLFGVVTTLSQLGLTRIWVPDVLIGLAG